MKYVDLHTHTYFSDGMLSPADLLDAAARVGLSAIAICDHDTTEAFTLLDERCIAHGGIEVVPGIELSAEHERTEVHMLGYYVDTENRLLQERLRQLRRNRIERVYRIIEKLKELGVALSPESVFSAASEGGTIGRMHIARAMVREGIVADIGAAFQRYIGDYAPAYVLGFRFSPVEAIQLIKDTGGIPVLAHPYLIRNDELVFALIKAGLMGLEVFYPEHSQSQTNFYRRLAEEHQLIMTGGSDYHGSAKPSVDLNCMKVPYDCLQRLKEARVRL